MKKLLTVLFVLALAATLSVSVFAAETVVEEVTITAPVFASDPESEYDSMPSYSITIPENDVNVVQPIKVSKRGLLFIPAYSLVPEMRYFTLYSDVGCTVPVDSWTRSVSSNEVKQLQFPIPVAGTYYLKISPEYSWNVSANSGTMTITPCVASAADRTLKSGKYTVGASSDSKQVTYYKISVAEAGYIAVQQKNNAGVNFIVELCDKSKTRITYRYLDGNNRCYPVKKGTYYLKTEGVSGSSASWYRLKYTFYKQTSSSFTMTNNKTKTIHQFDNETFYFRVKAEKTGTMTISNSGTYGAYVTLCNSSKKAITDQVYVSTSSSVSFAVTKGTTYYLKTHDSFGDTLKIKYKITGVSTGSNTTKAKAITLTKNKTKKFNFIAGSTKSYWFKFKASSSVKLNLGCTINGSGQYGVEFYKGSKKQSSFTMNSYYDSIVTSGKLSKGSTYYLKFTPKKLTSGTITLKLKS